MIKVSIRLKYPVLAFLMAGMLSSCASSERMRSGYNDESIDKYSIDCSGGLLTMEACKREAENLCGAIGYTELSKTHLERSPRLTRTMTIQCGKKLEKETY